MPSFTPGELLLYLYKDGTSSEKIEAVEEALRNNWTLREKLEVLQSSMKGLERIIESPRIEVVQNILKYARQNTVQEA